MFDFFSSEFMFYSSLLHDWTGYTQELIRIPTFWSFSDPFCWRPAKSMQVSDWFMYPVDVCQRYTKNTISEKVKKNLLTPKMVL